MVPLTAKFSEIPMASFPTEQRVANDYSARPSIPMPKHYREYVNI